jgi:hypothetical protein
METECVPCEVRTGYLNIMYMNLMLRRLNDNNCSGCKVPEIRILGLNHLSLSLQHDFYYGNFNSHHILKIQSSAF